MVHGGSDDWLSKLTNPGGRHSSLRGAGHRPLDLPFKQVTFCETFWFGELHRTTGCVRSFSRFAYLKMWIESNLILAASLKFVVYVTNCLSLSCLQTKSETQESFTKGKTEAIDERKGCGLIWMTYHRIVSNCLKKKKKNTFIAVISINISLGFCNMYTLAKEKLLGHLRKVKH